MRKDSGKFKEKSGWGRGNGIGDKGVDKYGCTATLHVHDVAMLICMPSCDTYRRMCARVCVCARVCMYGCVWISVCV